MSRRARNTKQSYIEEDSDEENQEFENNSPSKSRTTSIQNGSDNESDFKASDNEIHQSSEVDELAERSFFATPTKEIIVQKVKTPPEKVQVVISRKRKVVVVSSDDDFTNEIDETPLDELKDIIIEEVIAVPIQKMKRAPKKPVKKVEDDIEDKDIAPDAVEGECGETKKKLKAVRTKKPAVYHN